MMTIVKVLIFLMSGLISFCTPCDISKTTDEYYDSPTFFNFEIQCQNLTLYSGYIDVDEKALDVTCTKQSYSTLFNEDFESVEVPEEFLPSDTHLKNWTALFNQCFVKNLAQLAEKFTFLSKTTNLKIKNAHKIQFNTEFAEKYSILEKVELINITVKNSSNTGIWPSTISELIIQNSPEQSLPYFAIENLKTLKISSCSTLNDLSAISLYTSINRLIIENNENIIHLSERPFAKNKNLTYLKIDSAPKLNASNDLLYGLDNLKYLGLVRTRMKVISNGFLQYCPKLNEIKWHEDFCSDHERVFPKNFLKHNNFLRKFEYSPILKDNCSVRIEKSAFQGAYKSFEELRIKNTNLNYQDLFTNLAFHCTNLKKLDFENNNLEKLEANDAENLAKSLQVIVLALNPFNCDCSTITALSSLNGKIDRFDIKVQNCPNDTELTFNEASEQFPDSCITETEEELSLLILISVLICIAIVGITCITAFLIYKYRFWFYSQPLFSFIFNEDYENDLENNEHFEYEHKTYDAFLTYSEEDHQLMEDIYDKLTSGI